MDRRTFLRTVAATIIGSCFPGVGIARASTRGSEAFARVRPGDARWPSQARWNVLSNSVGGRLVRIEDPLAECRHAPEGPACQAFLKEMKNPYFLSDNPALTETSGWVDGWNSAPR